MHLSAVMLWIGGLGFNLLILTPSLAQFDLTNKSRMISKVLPNFLRLVWISISVIVFTGLYRVIFVNKMTTLSDFTDTAYGQSLLVKIIFVMVMIILVAKITMKFKTEIITHMSLHIREEFIQHSCSTCSSMLRLTRSMMLIVFMISFVVIFIAALLRGA